MPYDIVTADGIPLNNIPDHIPEDSPILKALAKREAESRRAAALPPDKPSDAGRKALQQMNPLDKLMANYGAGGHTFGQGVGQVLGLPGAPNDAELKASRAHKEELKASTDLGIMPDWFPTYGGAAQFVGENVGPAVAARYGAGPLTALPLVNRVAAPFLNSKVALGAAGGAAGGATQPTLESESRGMNTGAGAVFGTVLPMAYNAGKALWTRFGWNPRATQARAGDELIRDLGGEQAASQVATDVGNRNAQRAALTPEVRAIPETLSEATGSTAANRMEGRVRKDVRTQDEWADYLRQQNEARYNAVKEATKAAPNVERRKNVRDAIGDQARDTALTAAQQAPSQQLVGPVYQRLSQLANSPAVRTGSTRSLLTEVGNELRSIEAIWDHTKHPEHLYELRRNLQARLNTPIQNDNLSAAVQGSKVHTKEIMNAIDAALDAASQGQYGRYMRGFSRMSRKVDQAEAARDARDIFLRDKVQNVGVAPEVTAQRLDAAGQAGLSDFYPNVSALSPPAQRILKETVTQLKHANEPTKVRKLVGTQGGGSQTDMGIVDRAMDRLEQGSKLPLGIGKALTWAGDRSDAALRHELTRLLQNPDQAARAIRARLALRQPLSPAEQILWTAQGGMEGTGVGNLLRQNQGE